MSKGKNYSTNKKAKDRNKNDYYPTHYKLTEKLLDNYNIPYSYEIFEPATGEARAIEKIFRNRGYNIQGTALIFGSDYLASKEKKDWIATNPPFKLFNEFYFKAYHFSKHGFSLFGKVDFLTGKERFDWLYDTKLRPNYIFVYTRKANLLGEFREDGKYSTGIDGMCWFVKEHRNNNKTVIEWIDNNEDVYRKSNNSLRDLNKQLRLCKKYKRLLL